MKKRTLFIMLGLAILGLATSFAFPQVRDEVHWSIVGRNDAQLNAYLEAWPRGSHAAEAKSLRPITANYGDTITNYGDSALNYGAITDTITVTVHLID